MQIQKILKLQYKLLFIKILPHLTDIFIYLFTFNFELLQVSFLKKAIWINSSNKVWKIWEFIQNTLARKYTDDFKTRNVLKIGKTYLLANFLWINIY